MQRISEKDRQILRNIAHRFSEYAHSPQNETILKKWEALGRGQRQTPTVRLLFSNFAHEVITPRMQCEGETARDLEFDLLWRLVGRELFDDDTPVSPFFDIQWSAGAYPFALHPKITHASGKHAMGFHIDPVIRDLESEIDALLGGTIHIDKQATLDRMALINDVFGDILPPRLVQGCLTGSITNPLVHLMGMEAYYCAMYDAPEALHRVMDTATRLYETFYDRLEQEGLLLPTVGMAPLAQESYAFHHELPMENVTHTTQCWGFLESQETTAVSPQTFGAFVFPYQDRLVRRYGLLSYGCCERVDAIWPDYLSKWKNLRKLSVSPFNNEPLVGEYLRGTQVVYYSKPRAEYVTNPGPLDEDALRTYFRGVCRAASGCLFEMGQREVGTIFGDFSRGRRYVQIARECICEYWIP